MQPGIYPGLSFERYTSIERTNISTLKEMARSPLHYLYRTGNPREDSPAMSFGRSAHAAILEPERFEKEYVVWDQVTDSGELRPRRGKAWDAFCEFNKGKTIVRLDEYNFARNVRDAVLAKPVARKYLVGNGQRELALLWNDVETGRACKGRVDLLTHVEDVDCLVGVKTTRDLDPRRFSQQAAMLGYHLQFAFYHDGLLQLTGRAPRVVEICVEAVPPYDVTVYVIPPDVIELGRATYRELLAKLDECERTKSWPGRAENEVIFQLPEYLQSNDDEDVEGLGLEE
jgi:hypothetical protein